MGLSLESVAFTYGVGTSYADKALESVSLSVETGELVLVLGATGSGKSTLLRLAAGLLEPDVGSMLIDGVALTRASARGVVGLVFQDAESQLFADTVADDVAFGPRNLGASGEAARAAALQALTAVGLDPAVFGDRSPFALSGGEARRAAMAGVLAMRPRYLLLDEPTAGLDAAGRQGVQAIVRAARAASGVVVVSHSAEEFLGEADRVLVLDAGRPAFWGAGSQLVSDSTAFSSAGLRAPDVLRVQLLARERGADLPTLTLDPLVAARNLARAGGWG